MAFIFKFIISKIHNFIIYFKHISTIYRQDMGDIRIDGVSTLDEPEKIRKKMGVLFGGDVYLYDLLTATVNIMYFAMLQGVEKGVAQ